MLQKIETKINQWNESKFVQETKCLACTFWTVATIAVPAALSAYLIVRSEDKIVNILGVLAGVFAAFNLVVISYKANKLTGKKRKR